MDGLQQQGMTLIEVLVAMALLGLGLFAGAGLQLRALQATDSALRSTQAAYLAQGMIEQVRAVGALRGGDLERFRADVLALIGPGGAGLATLEGGHVRVLISWDDSRAGLERRSLSLSGQVAP